MFLNIQTAPPNVEQEKNFNFNEKQFMKLPTEENI